jgi:ATP-binding cassette, subfamily B, bacterial HlyB/CyaB
MSDSALNALMIVARHHGMEISATEMRRTYSIEGDEPPTSMLLAIALDLKLEAKQIRAEFRDLPRLQKVLPAILRLRDGSALVLEAVIVDKTSGLIASVRDPLGSPDARAFVDENRLVQEWDGEIILIKRRFRLTDEDRPFGMAWLAGSLLRERSLFRDIIIAAFISLFFTLTPPFILRIVIDRVLANNSYSTLFVLACAFVFMMFFEIILQFLRQLFLEVIGTRIDGRLHLYVMDKLLKLPLEYFENNPAGRILSKIAKAGPLRNFLTGQFFGTLLDIVTSLVLFPILFWISWEMALLVLAWTLCIFLLVLSFYGALRRAYGRVIQADHEKSAFMVESIYGMRTVKSLVLEGRQRRGWDLRVADSAIARYDFGRLANFLNISVLPFERMIQSGTLLIGAWIILNQTTLSQQVTSSNVFSALTTGSNPVYVMAPGLLIAFYMISIRAGAPLVNLARLMVEAGEVRGTIYGIATIVNTPAEDSRAGTGLRLPIQGDIEFQDVTFRYSVDAPVALDGVSFPVMSGTILGIMGRSGSGKSTITRLLQGLNAGYDGIIKISGMDLREIDLLHLRTSIGMVAQDNFLFSGTIRDNIGIARPNASFPEIVRAAQLAGAEEFIEKLPKGYNTMLSEGAVNLSGGQRQRLAIARALILDPAVLILDEATSALDAESEAIINANLMRIAEGRTIICVSHRLSMLVPAHSILVMEKGKVYDRGTHEELLHRCDIYRHMWHQQNRHVDQGTYHAPLTLARSQPA